MDSSQTASLPDRFAPRPLRSQNDFGKRGVIIGSFIVMFTVTIAIVLILLLMVVGSVVFKEIVRDGDNVDGDISVYDESKTGLGDVSNYMAGNRNFVEAKFLIEGGLGLDEALEEAGYEE